jgi:beta-lactamase superfamily II metal-dependent hydrolase
MSNREKLYSFILALLLVLGGGVAYTVLKKSNQSPGILQVSFLDVGQGDAILIEAPNGNQMLVDGGKNSSVLQALGKELPWYDKSIDVVLATHPDADHIGGLSPVLDRFQVDHFIEVGIDTTKEVEETLDARVISEGSQKTIALRGMRVMLDKENNIYFLILFPDKDVTGFETNTASIVGKLVYGSTSFLLTGDSPKEIEQYLITLNKGELDSDILKAGHHGSHTSTSEAFVQAVTPQAVIVSAGKDNDYGHPHKDVTTLLERLNIPMRATFDAGTITFESDGNVITAI